MKNALKWLLSPAVLGTLAVLALSLLLWWIGPLVALGSGSDVSRPLDGFWTRVAVLAVLWLAWLGRLGWQAWRRRRANALLAQGAAAGPSASDVEAQALAQRFQAAVAKLQAAPGAAGRSWLSGRRDGLYELPWYMFIGAPGSGKTTALLNAGLNFVLTDPAGGAPSGAAAVKGVGGTRNCDWFFTQDAVLIDTAGRYTLQQSDAGVDAAAWDKFLALLRQTRPRRPINGVLLTVNVQDLLQQSAAERSDHAERLRTRLQELQTKLGVRAPVYVLVTKADLIAGFTESFDALGKEGRDQVWGFSFDQAAPAAGEAALQDFDARYRALEERLVAGQLDRLQAERDVARRAAIFGFPQEFASLRPLLGGFLRQVFGAAAGLQDAVLLRGVYFTSGTQEGTPIDRVMGLLARSFGLERRTAALVGQHGKSFFLRRLLQDLVFPEAHLVSANPQAERRRLLLRGAGFATLAVAATALVVGWAVSHARNRAHVDLAASRLPALKAALDALPPATSADPAPLAQPLAAVRRAAQPDGFALDAPPLLHTLGLYQGDKLDAGARLGYQRLLRHALLPRVAKRLEERLRAANKDNLEQAYEALKAYRMLYTPAQFDADALKAWITLDWDSQLAGLPPEQRSALDGHLDALLALGAPQSGVQQDTALVHSVRDMLASYPLEYRIYSRLRRQHRNAVPELALGAMAGPLADKVLQRVSGEPLARGVPGLYTRAGYAKAFQGSLAATAAQLAGEAQWVLDQPADATAGAAGGARAAAAAALSDALPLKVRRLYLQDYIVVWDKLLADVRLIDLKGQPLSAVADMARVLAGADSPLAAFYRAVAAETSLVPAAPAGGAGLAGAAASAAEQARSAMRSLTDPTPAAPSAGPVEKMVDDHFAPIRRLVTGQPSPLDDMAKAFAAVQAQLQAVDAAQKSKSAPPPPGGGAGAKAAVAQAPEPVRKMVDSMVDIAERSGHAALAGTMTGELKPVYDFCVRAIANRYPIATSSTADVLPEDFGQFFGPGGQLDAFFQARLASLVDTSGNVWTYKPGQDGSRPAAPAALADFQRAARIREAFFRSGGKVPGFRLDIKAADLGGLSELVLDIDGQVSKLTANGAPITVAWPSSRVASQLVLSGGGGQGSITTNGPWALFRLFDRFDVQPGAQPEKFSVTVTLDGKRARLEVTANSVFNPFRLREVQQFRCPGAL